MTPTECSALAAITYVLDRACRERRELTEHEQRDLDTGEHKPRDPGLGYYLCPHTEAWGRLVRTEAALLGKPEREHEQYRSDCWEGRGDPEAPYRGLSVPREEHWHGPVLGHHWACDRYLLVRDDCGRSPPKARGIYWELNVPLTSIAVIVPTRSECSPDVPAGYCLPLEEVGRRLDVLAEGHTLLWSTPRGDAANSRPVIAVFRGVEQLPIVVCMPRLADKEAP